MVTQPGAEGEDDISQWELPSPNGGGGGQGNGAGQGGGVDGDDYTGGGDSLGGSAGRTDGGGRGGGGGNGGGLMNSQGGGSGGTQGGGAKTIGFAAVLQAEGYDLLAPETVVAELNWQKSVNGETAQNEAFIERVLGLQEFKAFGIMKGGSPWVQMAHGFGKFYSLYGTVPELDGKALMFVGDRGLTRDPVAVQPPVQNTWKWITVNAATDEAALLAFAQREGEMGLWTPGAGNHAPQDLKVPYVLALPGVLVKFIHGKGGQCRPHELLREVQRLAAEYPTVAGDNWDLVKTGVSWRHKQKATGIAMSL